MDIVSVIFVIVICILGSALMYGLYLLEDDRYQFKKKHGIDPKYHGWILKEKEDDTDKDK